MLDSGCKGITLPSHWYFFFLRHTGNDVYRCAGLQRWRTRPQQPLMLELQFTAAAAAEVKTKAKIFVTREMMYQLVAFDFPLIEGLHH